MTAHDVAPTHPPSHDHGDHDVSGPSHEHEAGRAHEGDHSDERGWRARLTHAVTPHSHDHADATDAALEASAEGIRAVKTSLMLLVGTSVLQAGVFLLSGSIALLADTIHNLSDGLSAVPLWAAFALSRRRPSRRYTYGLGRVEDLAGLVIVAMIAVSALVAGWESLRRLGDPRPVTHLVAVIAAGLVGFAGNEVVAEYRIRVGRRIGSAALVADGRHARADGITSLGVVVGALGVAAGWPLADPIVGLLISGAIVVVLVAAVRDVGRRLLDGVDPVLVDRAEGVLRETPGVLTLDGVRLRWLGHRLYGEAVVGVDPALDVVTAHGIADAATTSLRAALPQLQQVSVHVEPSH